LITKLTIAIVVKGWRSFIQHKCYSTEKRTKVVTGLTQHVRFASIVLHDEQNAIHVRVHFGGMNQNVEKDWKKVVGAKRFRARVLVTALCLGVLRYG
jgi:hypothetical protein